MKYVNLGVKKTLAPTETSDLGNTYGILELKTDWLK